MQPALRMRSFNESLIREMTRHAVEHGAINLSQGYPDFDPPQSIVDAAVAAIQGGENQYAVTWGYPPLRARLAEAYGPKLGRAVESDVHVTVTCGVTEAIVVSLMAVVNPGDEVIIVEPAHENFRPATIMAGGIPVALPLERPDYRLDPDRLAAAISPKTKAILINTPHNPTGRVFDDEEIGAIADLATKHDLVLITDEIYEHILYDGRVHRSPASYPALADRTLVAGGLSKTFAITGWRLGFVLAPDALASAVRRAHDYLTICAPTPLQAAAVAAYDLPPAYYEELTRDYQERRDVIMEYLIEAGFQAPMPEGAYYTIADYTGLAVPQANLPAREFALWLTREIGVAVVPMSSFYSQPAHGEGSVRFAFPKRVETLHTAGKRLLSIHERG